MTNAKSRIAGDRHTWSTSAIPYAGSAGIDTRTTASSLTSANTSANTNREGADMHTWEATRWGRNICIHCWHTRTLDSEYGQGRACTPKLARYSIRAVDGSYWDGSGWTTPACKSTYAPQDIPLMLGKSAVLDDNGPTPTTWVYVDNTTMIARVVKS